MTFFDLRCGACGDSGGRKEDCGKDLLGELHVYYYDEWSARKKCVFEDLRVAALQRIERCWGSTSTNHSLLYRPFGCLLEFVQVAFLYKNTFSRASKFGMVICLPFNHP